MPKFLPPNTSKVDEAIDSIDSFVKDTVVPKFTKLFSREGTPDELEQELANLDQVTGSPTPTALPSPELAAKWQEAKKELEAKDEETVSKLSNFRTALTNALLGTKEEPKPKERVFVGRANRETNTRTFVGRANRNKPEAQAALDNQSTSDKVLKDFHLDELHQEVIRTVTQDPELALPQDFDKLSDRGKGLALQRAARAKVRLVKNLAASQKELLVYLAEQRIEGLDLSEADRTRLKERLSTRITSTLVTNAISFTDWIVNTLNVFARSGRATIAPLTRKGLPGIPALPGNASDIPKILAESAKPTINILAAPFIKKPLVQDKEFLQKFDFYTAVQTEELGSSLSDFFPNLFNEDGEGLRFRKGGALDITGRGLKGFGLDMSTDLLFFLRGIPNRGVRVYTNNGRTALNLNKSGVEKYNRWVEAIVTRRKIDPSNVDAIRAVEVQTKDLIGKAIERDPAFLEKYVQKGGVRIQPGAGIIDNAPYLDVPIQLPESVSNSLKAITNSPHAEVFKKVIYKAFSASNGLGKLNPKLAKTMLDQKNILAYEKDRVINLALDGMKYNTPEAQAAVILDKGHGLIEQIHAREAFKALFSGENLNNFDELILDKAKQWIKKRGLENASERTIAIQARKFAISQRIIKTKELGIPLASEDARRLSLVLDEMADSSENAARYATIFPKYAADAAYLNWIPGIMSDAIKRQILTQSSLSELRRANFKQFNLTEGKVIKELVRRAEAGEEIPDVLGLFVEGQSRFLNDYISADTALKAAAQFGNRKFASADEALAAGWKQIRVGGPKSKLNIYLPKEEAEIMEPIFTHVPKMMDDPSARNILTLVGQKGLRAYDNFQSIWTSLVTVMFPSFHTRNAVTETINTFLDRGAGAFFGHNKALRMRAGQSFDIKTVGGRSYNSKQVREFLEKNGVIRIDSQVGKYSVDDLEDVIRVAAHGPLAQTRKALTQNAIMRAGRSAQLTMDEHMKATTFMYHLEKTGSLDDALRITNQFHANYQNLLSPFERAALRRMFPFYSFSKFNFPLQFSNMVKQPTKFSLPFKVGEALSRDMSEEERATQNNWMLGQLVIPVDYHNGETKYALVQGLPQLEAMGRFFATDKAGNIGWSASFQKAIGSLLTPAGKMAVELLMNKSLFFGSQIYKEKETDDVYDKAPDILQVLPKEVQEFIGVETIKDERTGRIKTKALGNKQILALYILSQLPLSRLVGESSKYVEQLGENGHMAAVKNLVVPIKEYRVNTRKAYEEKLGSSLSQVLEIINEESKLSREVQEYRKHKQHEDLGKRTRTFAPKNIQRDKVRTFQGRKNREKEKEKAATPSP